MKHYYYSVDGNDRQGPFTLDELKSKKLLENYLVWTDGMEDWTKAKDVDDLSSFVIASPPPLPKQRETTSGNRNSPIPWNTPIESTERATEALVIGLMLFAITVAVAIFSPEITEEERVGFAMLGAILRIGLTILVVNIAGKANRDKTGWGFFGFFLPTLALIVIGLLKKKRVEIPPNANKKELLDKAKAMYEDYRFDDSSNYCLALLKKSDDNAEVLALLSKSFFNLTLFDRSREVLLKLLDLNYKNDLVLYAIGLTYICEDDRKQANEFFQKSDDAGFENKQLLQKLIGASEEQSSNVDQLPSKL